jgi:hypothetical protein
MVWPSSHDQFCDTGHRANELGLGYVVFQPPQTCDGDDLVIQIGPFLVRVVAIYKVVATFYGKSFWSPSRDHSGQTGCIKCGNFLWQKFATCPRLLLPYNPGIMHSLLYCTVYFFNTVVSVFLVCHRIGVD